MCNTCNEKLNGPSNKKRRLNKRKQKCLENDERTKIKPPKCPSRKRPPAKILRKCLTRTEKIMLRIQPPIADRERYLHPEHVNCFLEESERVYVKKPKCPPCPSNRPKVCGGDTNTKKKKKKKELDENVEDEKNKDEKMENGKEKDPESGSIKQDGEENKKVVGAEEENLERMKATGQDKRNKKKKNKQKPNQKKNIEEDSSSEMSICSNDSEVCLVGLALTKEEKEKIEKNRLKVQPSPDNGENSTESSKNIQELTKQEDGDSQ